MARNLGLTSGHWEARMGCQQGVTQPRQEVIDQGEKQAGAGSKG